MNRFLPGLMEVQAHGSQPVAITFAQGGGENWRVTGGVRKPVAGGLLQVEPESGEAVRIQYWNALRMQGLWVQVLVLAWLLAKASRGFLRYSARRQSQPL